MKVIHLERTQRRKAEGHHIGPAEMILPIRAAIGAVDIGKREHGGEPGERMADDADPEHNSADPPAVGTTRNQPCAEQRHRGEGEPHHGREQRDIEIVDAESEQIHHGLYPRLQARLAASRILGPSGEGRRGPVRTRR